MKRREGTTLLFSGAVALTAFISYADLTELAFRTSSDQGAKTVQLARRRPPSDSPRIPEPPRPPPRVRPVPRPGGPRIPEPPVVPPRPMLR